MGAVAMACWSSHSIKKLARIGDTGLPMVVPNLCLNNCPLKKDVVAINSVRSIQYHLSLGLFISLDLDLFLGVLL